MLDDRKLKAAEAEIVRLNERIAAYRECQTSKFRGNYDFPDEHGPGVQAVKRVETLHESHGCPCTAAIKRASMDVTRAMVELRK